MSFVRGPNDPVIFDFVSWSCSGDDACVGAGCELIAPAASTETVAVVELSDSELQQKRTALLRRIVSAEEDADWSMLSRAFSGSTTKPELRLE